jgi:cysteinyl-tRNA synthetase
MQIKLYNSLTKTTESFQPVESNVVKMYSCGPTVYNYAHIGNMRAFLFADILQRVLRVVGEYPVRWVMNITNIDDKTIRDSALNATTWTSEMGTQSDDPIDNLLKFTDFYTQSFIEDINILGIKAEDFEAMPRATDYIEQMKGLITDLFNKGLAYVSEGSVYFNVNKWRQVDTYGKLFKIDFENFKPGTRVDTDQYEREQASDFALWKLKKPGEPFWSFDLDSQNCDGRPGWHIECSVMEKEILGLPFDIHTGGVDLKFPHHEDEIAQSKAGYGIEPTAFWCHNEFLEVEGEKMSKSLGNFFTVRDLMNKGLNSLDVRYLMLSSHYQSVLNFTFDGITASGKARQRVQDFIYDLFDNNAGSQSADALSLKSRVYEHLANDLHTPQALAEVFSFINNNPAKTLNSTTRSELIEFFKDLNRVFSVWEINPRAEVEILIPQNIKDMAEERLKAKQDKNWAKSDELRDKLKAEGWLVKDNKEGYTLEKI